MRVRPRTEIDLGERKMRAFAFSDRCRRRIRALFRILGFTFVSRRRLGCSHTSRSSIYAVSLVRVRLRKCTHGMHTPIHTCSTMYMCRRREVLTHSMMCGGVNACACLCLLVWMRTEHTGTNARTPTARHQAQQVRPGSSLGLAGRPMCVCVCLCVCARVHLSPSPSLPFQSLSLARSLPPSLPLSLWIEKERKREG